MTDILTYRDFEKVYLETVEEVYTLWTPEMQQSIAQHNLGWAQPYNFHKYLIRSTTRFYRAYKAIPNKDATCLDLGGFWGVFPLTLKKLGFDVTMTEAKKYYDSCFNNLFDHIENSGVNVVDLDPFETDIPANYDFITILAVMEHIPFSLKYFLGNVKQHLSENGVVYADVPNMAYYFKRTGLLMGKTPLPDIMTIYNSKVPFTGHHHEFTRSEFETLFSHAGFKVIKTELFNYSIDLDFKFILQHPVASFFLTAFGDTREVIGITVKHNS